jgi:Ca2+-binding EF-hand superfamily protein
MKMDMKMMDSNGDGMISKDEFMKFHEMMFDKMKKNKSGMIDTHDMDAMHHNMQMMHMDESKGKDGAPMKEKKSK